MNLKEKTISGLTWSAADSFARQGIIFLVSIILARLLSPEEFGIIGMTLIFMTISQVFVESGLNMALIRKARCTNDDYSTVFYFNLIIGFVFYGILFFSAGAIAEFFEEPVLKPVLRFIGLDLIFKGLTSIQVTTLTKRVDFRLMTKISVISAIISGIVAIAFALMGYGVWSLVARIIVWGVLHTSLMWLWNRWRPTMVFSISSFRELFGFGSKLLASNLIDTTYNNLNYLIIGKYFSATDLGYFTRAKMFSDLPSLQITTIMSRVTYPVLAMMREDKEVLKSGYRRMITGITFLSFAIMTGLAAMAEPMVITLIGEPWRPMIIYLQMLCFIGMIFPLSNLNINMLNVQGRSDLLLRIEIIKKILAVPVFIFGILYGIKILIIGMMIHSVIAYYLDSFWSGKMTGYSLMDQLKDVMPAFIVSALTGVIVFIAGLILPFSYLVVLLIQCMIWLILIIGISELARLSAYLYIKDIVLTKIKDTLKRGEKSQ